MSNATNQFASAAMLIRKPVATVFNAFVDPEVTTKFWFSKSSGPLGVDKQVEWTWEEFNVSAPVKVQEFIVNEKITIEWGDGAQLSTVEFSFQTIANSNTYVSIKNYNFQGSADAILSSVRDSTGGFTIVLAGLKAYLEHGILLNLISDKWPVEMR